MSGLKRLGLLLILLIGTQPLLASPKIQHWKTDNGMPVYFVPAPEIPMLDIRVTFAAGATRDAGMAGLASLTSSMLGQGAGDYDVDGLADAFADLGAGFGRGSRRDMAWLSLRSLSDPEYLQPALEIFSDVLWQPTFPEKDYQRVKSQYLVGLKAQQASAGSIASKAYYKALYGDHPYASPASGTLESVPEITLENIQAFHQRYYVAANGVISILGDIKRPIAEKLANILSEGLPVGKPAEPLPPVKPLESGKTIKIEFPSKQAHVLMGQLAVERGNINYLPLYLGNHGFGGSGLSSDLSKLIRDEHGYAYSVGSYFQPMEGVGPFTISLQTRGDQTDDAIDLVRQSLSEFMEKGPTETRISASLSNITSSFPLKIATNSNILQYLTFIGFYGLPLDYLDTYNDQVSAISKQNIMDAFKKTIDPNKMITVVVGGEG